MRFGQRPAVLAVAVIVAAVFVSAAAAGKPDSANVTITSAACAISAGDTWSISFAWKQTGGKTSTPTGWSLMDPNVGNGESSGMTAAVQKARKFNGTFPGSPSTGAPTDSRTFTLFSDATGTEVDLASVNLTCTQT
jgi:hypothetical protein